MSENKELSPVEKVAAGIFIFIPLMALMGGLLLWGVLYVWSKVFDLL